jgi:hypothetical protein
LGERTISESSGPFALLYMRLFYYAIRGSLYYGLDL